jgi:hypothetical protein
LLNVTILIAAEEYAARQVRIQIIPVRGAIWRRGCRREVRRSLVFTAKEATARVGAMAKEEEEAAAEEKEEEEEEKTAAAMASVTGHCI